MLYWWREEEGAYVREIQALKAEKPLPLPPIKPLVAKKVDAGEPVSDVLRRIK